MPTNFGGISISQPSPNGSFKCHVNDRFVFVPEKLNNTYSAFTTLLWKLHLVGVFGLSQFTVYRAIRLTFNSFNTNQSFILRIVIEGCDFYRFSIVFNSQANSLTWNKRLFFLSKSSFHTTFYLHFEGVHVSKSRNSLVH